MFLVSTPNQHNPLPTVTMAAKVRAEVQPNFAATLAVTMGESHPPRLPNVFINPATEPENSGQVNARCPECN